MVKRRANDLFVEGGGEGDELRTQCRKAFQKLLERAGFARRMPRIHACGGRKAAYDDFCAALDGSDDNDFVMLLVDAEAAVSESSPWEHVRKRQGDGWKKPSEASEDHLQLMVQVMETWFLADRAALEAYYGQGFKAGALPASTSRVEDVAKNDLLSKLSAATKNTKKGTYAKGEHSFMLLATLDPQKIRGASPWAERFFSTLDKMLGDPGRA